VPGVLLNRLQVAITFSRVVQDIQVSGPSHSEIAKVPAGLSFNVRGNWFAVNARWRRPVPRRSP
jgi:hypothetical protein